MTPDDVAHEKQAASASGALITKAMPLGILGAAVGNTVLWGVILFATGTICADAIRPVTGPHVAGTYRLVSRLLGILTVVSGTRALVEGLVK